jgi:hypothetical protein
MTFEHVPRLSASPQEYFSKMIQRARDDEEQGSPRRADVGKIHQPVSGVDSGAIFR